MEMGNPAYLWLSVLIAPAVLLLLHRYRRDSEGLRRLVGEWRYQRYLNVFQVKSFFSGLFFLLFLIMGVIALSDMKGGRELVEDDREGYDLVFLLDVSRSMLAPDEAPHRLGRAIRAIEEIVKEIPGARFGVVAFKGKAFRLLPLTEDLEALSLVLGVAGPGITTSTGSNLQAGILSALDSLGEGGRYRAVFLFSDGESLDGDALAAARDAGKRGVPLIAIGLGSEDGTKLVLADGEAVRDRQGRIVVTRLDRRRMEEIARVSGGRYYPGSELDSVARQLTSVLKGLRSGDFTQGVRAVKRSLYRLFLSLSLLFLSLSLAVRAVRWRDTL